MAATRDDEMAIPELLPFDNGEKVSDNTHIKSAGEESALTPVPVTIITGFLGSGKTTLLNYILTANHGYRIAVIENEFGEEIGVESLIAKDGSNGQVFDDFYELSNGCICCSVRDDLVNTLERVLEKRDRFDYILVETTGMANPGKVASIFWVDDELEGRIYLDGIVTLVDAHRIQAQLATPDTLVEASSQVAYADRILLNKRDLVTDVDQCASIEQCVRDINGIADITWTQRSQVQLDTILNVKSFTTQRALDVEKALVLPSHTHTGGVQTVCITINDGLLDREKLERWLGGLLWDQDDNTEATDSHQKFFRIKGVLAVGNEPNKFILQAVHELFEVYPSDEQWREEDQKHSKIVFIGLWLEKQALVDGLRSCLAA